MIEIVLVNPDQKQERYQFATGPIELGRENPRTLPRVVVNDRFTSRHQVLIDDAADGQFRIENITDNPGRPVRLSNGVTLNNGEKAFVEPPVRLFFGKTTVDLRRLDTFESNSQFQTIQRSMIGRREAVASALSPQHTIAGTQGPPTVQRVTEWFEALLTVQKAAAGSTEFYHEAAKAVVEMIGLDRGMVILHEQGQWQPRAMHPPEGHDPLTESRRLFSRTILDKIARDKNTIFQTGGNTSGSESLIHVQAVVASPIFDERDQVIGVVYGSREMKPNISASGVRPIEAQFVQVLAGMVSAGLARAQREEEAARMRVQFEGFFSKPLAEALQRDPKLLEARCRELTMLFLDLRGFSRIAERVEAGETYHFLSECLNRFTETVMKYDGVVIDYYGDGFAAMWNAPLDQESHAELAAKAALEMRAIVPELNEKYQSVLGTKVNVGIGIHTGDAQVGNSGTTYRLKYGPRGHAVNLTSRVETATKHVGVNCLVTEATRKKLPEEMQVRRICRARLAGMAESVELFELGGTEPPEAWIGLRRDYEEALRHYEAGESTQCLQCCARIVASGTSDDATRWLLTLANQRLSNPDASPGGVVDLPK